MRMSLRLEHQALAPSQSPIRLSSLHPLLHLHESGDSDDGPDKRYEQQEHAQTWAASGRTPGNEPHEPNDEAAAGEHQFRRWIRGSTWLSPPHGCLPVPRPACTVAVRCDMESQRSLPKFHLSITAPALAPRTPYNRLESCM